MSAEPSAFPGQWLPVVEAAHALRVSERTLRRQLQHGRFQTQSGERGTEVWVSTRPTPLGMPGDAGQAPGSAGHVPGKGDALPGAAWQAPDMEGQAVDALVELLREERERAGAAEQAAAMWQERARNLETQVEQLLALPAHTDPTDPEHRWWQWWRRGRANGR